jgi:hypothetical protein
MSKETSPLNGSILDLYDEKLFITKLRALSEDGTVTDRDLLDAFWTSARAMEKALLRSGPGIWKKANATVVGNLPKLRETLSRIGLQHK